MERLSRVYFSGGGASEAGGETEKTPVAFFPILNAAGERGERAVDAIRRFLTRDGIRSFLAAAADAGGYGLPEEEGALLDGPALLGRLRAEEGLRLFFLFLPPEPSDRNLRLLCRGDNSLLLVESDVSTLVEAYRVLKRLNGIEGGTMPALLSVSPRRDAWDSLAPRRLAEGAERFLRRRVPLWEADGPERIAARIAEGLLRMRSRKEGGVEPLLRRIMPVFDEKD